MTMMCLRAGLIWLFLLCAVPASAQSVYGPTPNPVSNHKDPVSDEIDSKSTLNDYPLESLRNREEGVVVIAFEVNEKGLAENCRVTKSSGFPRLDAASCIEFVNSARFRPETNDAGVPVRSTGQQKIRWQIPRHPHRNPMN
jgi:TonB family protein